MLVVLFGWVGWMGVRCRLGDVTFGHVAHLVLAHGFEGLVFELALGFGVDAEEVEVSGYEGYDAGEGAEAEG